MANKTKAVEPVVENIVLDITKFSVLLSWYNQHKTPEDAANYFSDYLTEQAVPCNPTRTLAFVRYVPTIGFVCRIIHRGGLVPKSTVRWLAVKVEEFQNMTPTFSEQLETAIAHKKPEKLKELTVHDHMAKQVSGCIGELEAAIDEIILQSFSMKASLISPLVIMRAHQIKSPQAKEIINWFKTIRDEYRAVLFGENIELVESYSNFSRPQMKKLEAFADKIMSDGLIIIRDALARQPLRTRKRKSPEIIAKRAQYLPTHPELGLTSLLPSQVVGAMAAWTYNVKTRNLTLHVADDASGLTFKGSTVFNTAKQACVTKMLRKPAAILEEILTGSNGITKKLMETLTTKAKTYKNRLNKDSVIVRVHK